MYAFQRGMLCLCKELIKGESYVALSDEEKEAIERAKTLDEEIADIMEEE